MNQELSILNSIKDVRIVPTKSKNTGNVYDRLVINFYQNNYEYSTPIFGDTPALIRLLASTDQEQDDNL